MVVPSSTPSVEARSLPNDTAAPSRMRSRRGRALPVAAPPAGRSPNRSYRSRLSPARPRSGSGPSYPAARLHGIGHRASIGRPPDNGSFARDPETALMVFEEGASRPTLDQSIPGSVTAAIRTPPSSAPSSIRKSPASPPAQRVPDRSRRKLKIGRLAGSTPRSWVTNGTVPAARVASKRAARHACRPSTRRGATR